MNACARSIPSRVRQASGGGRPGRRQWLATALVAAVCCTPSVAIGAPQTEPKRVGHVTVQVFADREAVAPGQVVEFAVSVKPDKDWYVYWQNPGAEVGLPTTFEWTIPKGYKIGRTRYPVPAVKYEKVLKATNYVHEGRSLFITPVRAPETAKPGTDATFKVKVSWLMCSKGQCVPGEAEVSLKLPVVDKGTAAKPMNAKVFQEARAALPVPLKEAKHVKISGSIDKEAVKPRGKFTATLTAELEAKHHMQSHKPGQEGLIPAVVFVELTDGLDIGAVKYPKADEREDKVLGKMSEYGGKAPFKIPVEVDKKAGKSPRWIRGVFQYQICSDAGTCYPPQFVEFAIPVQIDGGPAPKADADEWATGAGTSGGGGPPSETNAGDAAAPGGEGTPGGDGGGNVIIRFQNWLISFGFAGVILAGLLGGLLLNLMPCVLPVISLKVLSFVRQAHEDRARIFRLGLTYSAGIMTFYLLLAYLFFAFNKGWGELFQDPIFVIVMAAVVLAFALSLFGVFSVFAPQVVSKLGEKTEREGYPSAFFSGVLATLLGTACTAPFLSAAIGYASQLPPLQGTSVFIAAGFGMAFPVIALSYNPAWLRFVPKPGPWFGVFEAIMGFLLLATVVWLLNPLRGQIGSYGLLLATIFLLSVAIAVWIKGKIGFGAPLRRKIKLYVAAAVVLAAGWLLPFRAMATVSSLMDEHIRSEDLIADGMLLSDLLKEMGPELAEKLLPRVEWEEGKIPWQPYRRSRAMLAVSYGYTAFVDYTADWCASCKTNLKASIDREEVRKLMRELNVVPYEADYTVKRPEIAEELRRFKRAGVPLYLVYRPGDTRDPEVLPELLTPQMVIDALRRAGPSKPMSAPAAPAGSKSETAASQPAETAPASEDD